jgi:two-component system, sensor histidine kinase RegB
VPDRSKPISIDGLEPGDSQLRLLTLVRLRWLAIVGQLLAICIVALGFGFSLPVEWCLFIIACSAWFNVYLSIRFPPRHRLTIKFATAQLAYDVVQLAALLYLTGGIENPFTMLIVAPVTVSAATLPIGSTIILGVLGFAATVFISIWSLPLPWEYLPAPNHPPLYDFGVAAAVTCTMTFIALYAWRLTRESREMSAALSATELILAREQKLHALDGLAAAAAHELGTPLSTIALVTKELERQVPEDSPMREDIVLLRHQALRCREILQKLTKHPSEQDPLHGSVTVQEMLAEAAAPYDGGRAPIHIFARAAASAQGEGMLEPVATRRPGVLYGLGNILENAVDFATSRVDLMAEWDAASVNITISDDGPGFKPEIIDNLGEPYVTSRPGGSKKSGGKAAGLGLGFFIAKTLLERSGAKISLENRPLPQKGAVVRIAWPRPAFVADIERPGPISALPRTLQMPPAPEVYDR